MTTAVMAFSVIERTRPEWMEKIGLLFFLVHPVAGPFWVAAGTARGKETVRRKAIECGRWADDIKFNAPDKPTDLAYSSLAHGNQGQVLQANTR